jgi:hypothetical protein
MAALYLLLVNFIAAPTIINVAQDPVEALSPLLQRLFGIRTSRHTPLF